MFSIWLRDLAKKKNHDIHEECDHMKTVGDVCGDTSSSDVFNMFIHQRIGWSFSNGIVLLDALLLWCFNDIHPWTGDVAL